jgi:hypothetical protein
MKRVVEGTRTELLDQTGHVKGIGQVIVTCNKEKIRKSILRK